MGNKHTNIYKTKIKKVSYSSIHSRKNITSSLIENFEFTKTIITFIKSTILIYQKFKTQGFNYQSHIEALKIRESMNLFAVWRAKEPVLGL